MNLAYMEYLEALPAQAVQGLVSDWIRSNPCQVPGSWRNHWNGYALSIRSLVWMQEIARGRLQPTGEVLESLCEQIRFLVDNLELDIRGNHLMKNIKALLWACAFFQGPESEAWGRRGIRLLERELQRQILHDGVHYERSPAYHLQVFADLLECYHVLTDGPVRARLGETLDRMAQATADLVHPDGRISLFNDGGLDMAYHPSTCLQAHTSLRSKIVLPRERFSLPQAGYFGAREGGAYLLIDCGPVAPDTLPAHGHGDILSFEWSLGGRRWIVDTGVFEYPEGPRRSRSRSTAAHNTLTLDNLDQCEFWKSFRIGRRAKVRLDEFSIQEKTLLVKGSHTGYVHLPGRPVHHRTFNAHPLNISVLDRVEGGIGQRAEARLLLHPDIQIEQRQERDMHLFFDGQEVRLQSSHPMGVEQSIWFPNFGVEINTLQIIIDYGNAPCQGSFHLKAI